VSNVRWWKVDDSPSPKGAINSYQISAPWLGEEAECVIDPSGFIVLRDTSSGAHAKLDLDEIAVKRKGSVLSCRKRVGHILDFGGFGWNGRYHFVCEDEQTAVNIVEQIKQIRSPLFYLAQKVKPRN
jgi:hypothetical protein